MRKSIRYGEIKDGITLCVYGYLLTAKNVKRTNEDGQEVTRFSGVCTADSCNDEIRNTGYDGGALGAYSDVFCTVEV